MMLGWVTLGRDIIWAPVAWRSHALLLQVNNPERFQADAVSMVSLALMYMLVDLPMVLLQSSSRSYKLSMTAHHAVVVLMSAILLRTPYLTSKSSFRQHLGVVHLFEVSSLWLAVHYHARKLGVPRPVLTGIAVVTLATLVLFRLCWGSWSSAKFILEICRAPEASWPLVTTVSAVHVAVVGLNCFWVHHAATKFATDMAMESSDYTS